MWQWKRSSIERKNHNEDFSDVSDDKQDDNVSKSKIFKVRENLEKLINYIYTDEDF